jgi:hypothetical protein
MAAAAPAGAVESDEQRAEALVFRSGANLTPDDRSGQAAPQIFRYDAQSGAIVRISIGQKGSYLCPATEEFERFNCNGNTNSEENRPSINFPGYEGNDEATRATSSLTMSNDGSIVVFASRDSLTPQAVPGVRNVYEYSGGEVSLISNGQGSPAPGSAAGAALANRMLGIDASGDDVFFATADPLLAHSTDTSFGFYDARTGGGFPTPAVSATCQGEACQGPLGATPPAQAAGTGANSGLGNPKPNRKSKKHRKHRHRNNRANHHRGGAR